jgi:hypothetical protein
MMLFMTGSFLSNVSKRAAKSLVPYRFGRGDRWINAEVSAGTCCFRRSAG